jgi:hypothetical protein
VVAVNVVAVVIVDDVWQLLQRIGQDDMKTADATLFVHFSLADNGTAVAESTISISQKAGSLLPLQCRLVSVVEMVGGPDVTVIVVTVVGVVDVAVSEVAVSVVAETLVVVVVVADVAVNVVEVAVVAATVTVVLIVVLISVNVALLVAVAEGVVVVLIFVVPTVEADAAVKVVVVAQLLHKTGHPVNTIKTAQLTTG